MSPLSLIILFIIFPTALIYSLIRRRLEWRRKLKECGFAVAASESLFFGNLDLVNNEYAPWLFSKLRNIYGHTYAIMLGAFPTIVTSNPEVIQDVCLKKFQYFHSRFDDPTGPLSDGDRAVNVFAARGERWKRIRSLISPALSTQNLKKLYPSVCDSISKFLEGLKKDALSSTPVDLHSRFQALTYDVIFRCCIGREESVLINDPNLALILEKFSPKLDFHKYSNQVFSWCLPEFRSLFSWYRNMMGRINAALGRSQDPFSVYADNLRNIIDAKIKNEEKFDFSQFLKNVEDNNWEGWKVYNDKPVEMAKVKIAKKMLIEEIVLSVRFMSTAGFDTTANTLAYLVYMLANKPEEQEKLREEIESFDMINHETVQKMEYLHWSFAEILRLYPHSSFLQSRRCVADCEVEGFLFPKGVNILFDTWSLHHDPEIWGDDVEEYRPDRFGAEKTMRQMQSWTPFGVGPRQCIGMRFALMEAKTALCAILKNFTVKPLNGKNKLHLRLREMGTVWPDSSEVLFELRE